MSHVQALTCDRCNTPVVPAPEELPKGWLHYPLGDKHTCPKCVAFLKEINPFLDWLPSEICKRAVSSGSCIHDTACSPVQGLGQTVFSLT